MFIAVEGIGGSGKGTLMVRLCELMKAQGIDHVRTREPGGTSIAEQLRRLVREGFSFDGGRHFANPWATTLLFNAARAQHVEELIIPSLRQDKVVLCDRFCDSTFVYQSVFMGLELDKLKALHNLVIGVYPDMTFLLDCPAEIANNRVTPQEKAGDQFDRATLDKQEAMRQAYLDLAKEHPERYCVIDAQGNPEEVWVQVEKYFLRRLLPLQKDHIFRPSTALPSVPGYDSALNRLVTDNILKQIEVINAECWNKFSIRSDANQEELQKVFNEAIEEKKKEIQKLYPDSYQHSVLSSNSPLYQIIATPQLNRHDNASDDDPSKFQLSLNQHRDDGGS